MSNVMIGNNPLRLWDSKSAVRSKPRRVARLGDSDEACFFNESLVPALRHRDVTKRGPAFCQNVQIFHLFRYLEYTDFIEIEIVNRSLHPIMRFRFNEELPEEMILGAYKIYVDEGYHAEMSVNLRAQINDLISLPPQKQFFPAGLKQVVSIIHNAPPRRADLMFMFSAIVSETLISNNLKQAVDPRIMRPVRELIQDHYEDEKTHHAFFSQLLRLLWPRLDKETQIYLGRTLPKFIESFLMPDSMVAIEDLASLGMPKKEAMRVVDECYGDRNADTAVLRKAAASTLSLFHRAGLFEISAIAEAFAEAQLIRENGQPYPAIDELV